MSYRNILKLLSIFVTLSQVSLVQAERQKFIQSNNSVPGKYIVVLNEPSNSQVLDVISQEAITFFGASLGNTYSDIFQGFSAYLDEQQAISLSNDPRIKFIEQVSVLSTPPNERVERRKRKRKRRRRKNKAGTWGLDRIDQVFLPLNQKYRRIGRGEGVNVYVVDSGIRLSHQEFEGRAKFGINTTLLPFDDCNFHGTHVAGTIGGKTYGVAKKVNLIAVKALGAREDGECVGKGDSDRIIAGLDWIKRNVRYPAVVNMSLGGLGRNQALEMAIESLIAQGITVVVSAGNNNWDANLFTPAHLNQVITVGASDEQDEKASFSNWGSKVDLFAPGFSIISAGNESDVQEARAFGTSMAAPHVTGFVALLLQKNPSLTPTRIENIVKHHATKGLVRGLENFPGTPNRLLSIRHVPDLTDFAKLDPYFYLNMNPDVSAAVGGVENFAGGAAHWEAQGKSEGRMSSPAHWPEYYFTLYEDLANFFGPSSRAAAHNHWLHSGRAEGRSGSPAFDPPFYFSLYPELQNAFGQNNFRLATDHWIQNGIEEGRTGSVAFDPFFYLSAHPDVEANVGERNYREALLHWFKYGINEGRRASWFFDPVAYMQHNPDVAAAFGATNYKIGLFHYMKYGRFEGRRATP